MCAVPGGASARVGAPGRGHRECLDAQVPLETATWSAAEHLVLVSPCPVVEKVGAVIVLAWSRGDCVKNR